MSATFEPISTPAIERAQRLMSVRANQGFRDIIQISLEIVNSLTAIATDYPGWDKDQLMVLNVRAKTAKEHHELLFARIQDAIRTGVQEQAAHTNLTDKSVTEVLETGDFVRQEVLTRFSEMDFDGRLPGTY
jgi:predicted GTPase